MQLTEILLTGHKWFDDYFNTLRGRALYVDAQVKSAVKPTIRDSSGSSVGYWGDLRPDQPFSITLVEEEKEWD